MLDFDLTYSRTEGSGHSSEASSRHAHEFLSTDLEVAQPALHALLGRQVEG